MRFLVLAIALCFSVTAAAAERFQLTSPDVAHQKMLANAQVFNGFGCTGENHSPALAWKGAPAGAKSFAITVYDPDAPTGSGFWHWLVYDIPASTTGLASGAKGASLPAGAVQARNDFGAREFSGACPPPGDAAHHYVFTIFALKVEKLGVPADASAALIGFNLRSNSLATATITATYKR
jgi:Raf kinase inhibitor-like YbhB/YbcL family protein